VETEMSSRKTGNQGEGSIMKAKSEMYFRGGSSEMCQRCGEAEMK